MSASGNQLATIRGFHRGAADCYSVERTGLINSRVFVTQFFTFQCHRHLDQARFPGRCSQAAFSSPALSRALSISWSQTVGSGYCTLATCDNDHQRGSIPVGSGFLYYVRSPDE